MKLDNKNKMLLLGLVALLFLSYHLAIKKTLSLRADYLGNLENQELSKNIPLEIAKLNQKEKYLDDQFLKLNLSSSAFQTDLLKFLNEKTTENNINTMVFGAPHLSTNNDLNIKTHEFTLEGTFNGILRTLNTVETQSPFGSISHIQFEKQLDYKTKKSSLLAKVHLKQVEN